VYFVRDRDKKVVSNGSFVRRFARPWDCFELVVGLRSSSLMLTAERAISKGVVKVISSI
jgi:hypothetical protein